MKKTPAKKLIHLASLLVIALSPPAVSFGLTLPDTGQDLCYDWERLICDEWHMEGANQVCDSKPYCPEEGEDFYGQDAHYTINPPDLTDNGDGTVTDNLTGLVWEQKTAESEQSTFSHQEALSYCDTLSLGNFDDWRVPTRKEFSTLLNLGTISPALDTTYFPDYSYTSASGTYYWTSTPYHDDPAQVWKIQISFGISEALTSQPPPYKVRCVRGDSEPAPSFTDNGDGTVTDNATGLMWEQKTTASQGCIVEAIYGDASYETKLLRAFKDTVLSTTPVGRELIDLYYTLSPVLVQALQGNAGRDKDDTYPWKDALAYCENLVLGNVSDWRLPNPKELERIVDLETSNPAVDATYFPNTNSGFYWTGTTCVGCHKFKAFAYDFSDGELYFGVKYRDGEYGENFVRCVRGGGSAAASLPSSYNFKAEVKALLDEVIALIK